MEPLPASSQTWQCQESRVVSTCLNGRLNLRFLLVSLAMQKCCGAFNLAAPLAGSGYANQSRPPVK